MRRYALVGGFLLIVGGVSLFIFTTRGSAYDPDRVLTPSGYRYVSQLKIGDEVMGYDSGQAVINRVEGIEYVRTDAESDSFKYYRINDKWEFFENQSIRSNGKVVHVSQLKLGDILYDSDSKPVVISSIHEVVTHPEWYKLSVSGNHDYIGNSLLLHNASRYWVGGTGNWTDDDNHWATASGGVPADGNLPASTDDVFFDSNSNAGDYTLTTDSTVVAGSITTAAPAAGNMSWTGNGQVQLRGSLSLYATISLNANGGLQFLATSGTQNLTTAGITLISPITINGTGGTLKLLDKLTMNATAGFTLTAGSFDANGQDVEFQGVATAPFGTFTGSNAFYNLSKIGAASKIVSMTLTGDIEVTNLLTITGQSAVNRVFVNSSVIGTPRTITAASVSVSGADFRDMVGAWAASWDMSAAVLYSGDAGGNSMKSLGSAAFTTATTQTSTGTASFTWSTHGWTSRVPLPQDDVVINNAFVAGRTVTLDMPRAGKNINWTGTTGTPTFSVTVDTSIFGSLTLIGDMVAPSATIILTFEGRGDYTLTSAGLTLDVRMAISAPGGKLTLQDALTLGSAATRILTLNNGELAAGTNNVTAYQFSSSNSNTRTISGSAGTWLLTGVDDAWQVTTSSGLTTSMSGVTIKFNDSSNTAMTFAGGGKTYGNIYWSRGASTASNTITGSNTFADFKDDGSAAHSILFTAGTNTTVSTWTVSGTAGNLITINSSNTSTHTLTKAGGGYISSDYLNIQHSIATPNNTWYAGNNSTNNQGVATAGSGWIFTPPADCNSIVTGNWNTAGTWSCGHVPGHESVAVSVGHTVTMDVDSATLSTTTINGTLDASASNYVLNLDANFYVSDGATFNPRGATVTFSSSSPQTASSSNFHSVNHSGSGIFTITGTTTATGNLYNAAAPIYFSTAFSLTGTSYNSGTLIQINPGRIISPATSIALDKGSYNTGTDTSISVTLVDSDENVVGTTTDTTTVTVSAGSDSETVILTETGNATYNFTGTLPLAQASATVDNGILEVSGAGTITASYIDNEDLTDNAMSTAAGVNQPPASDPSGSGGTGGNGPILDLTDWQRERDLARGISVGTGTSTPPPGTITTSTPSAATTTLFTRNLRALMLGEDVRALQVFLNTHGFVLAENEPGAPGQETNKFGRLTYRALIRLQEAYPREILEPWGITWGTGFFGPTSRAYVNSQLIIGK